MGFTLPLKDLERLTPTPPPLPSRPAPVSRGFQRPDVYEPPTYEPPAPPPSFEFDDPWALGEGQGNAFEYGPVGPQGPYAAPRRPQAIPGVSTLGAPDLYDMTDRPTIGEAMSSINTGPALGNFLSRQAGDLGIPGFRREDNAGELRRSGDIISENLGAIPYVGPVAERAFELASPLNVVGGGSLGLNAKMAGLAAVGGPLARGAAKEAGFGETGQNVADIAGSIIAPFAPSIARGAVSGARALNAAGDDATLRTTAGAGEFGRGKYQDVIPRATYVEPGGRYTPSASGGSIRAAEGEATTRLYRGDAKATGPLALSKGQPTALFGQGLYFTDSPDVARSYQLKGGNKPLMETVVNTKYLRNGQWEDAQTPPSEEALEDFYQAMVNRLRRDGQEIARPNPGGLNIPREQAERALQILRDAPTDGAANMELRRYAYSLFPPESLDVIDVGAVTPSATKFAVVSKGTFGGKQTAIDLPQSVIDNVLDAETPLPPDAQKAIARAIAENMNRGDGTQRTLRDVFRNIGPDERTQVAIRRSLSDMGYTGLRYDGGRTMAGMPHNAYVFWDEQAIQRLQRGESLKPPAFPFGGARGGAFTPEESLLERLARTNKIRASQGKPPMDAIPVAWLRGAADEVVEEAAPVVAAAKELTPDEVARIQQKVAREGMTPENKALLDDALGRLFKVADDVPAASPPIPINPQVSGNLDRLMNPGKLEGQAQTVEDALARARFDGPTTAPVSVPGRAALDASRNAEQSFLDEFGSGPAGKGTTLQARIIPGLSNSSSTGAVLGGATGYGTTDEDATPLQTAQNVAKGALIGMAVGSIVGTGAGRVQALQAARKLNGVQGQLGVNATRTGRLQAGKELAQDIYKVFSPSELLNLTRTTASSGDFSGTLRQGGWLGPRHNKELRDMFAAQVKTVFGSGAEARAQAIKAASEKAPMARYRRDLYHSDWNGTNLSQREEAFASSLAGEIPGVAATSRGYATGLNVLRDEVFDSVVGSWPEAARTPQRLAEYQRYLEAATGRGSIPKALEGVAGLMNGLFFSPRFMLSIPQRHLAAFTTDPYVRKEVIKDMAGFYGTGLTILGLAAAAKSAFGLSDDQLSIGVSDPNASTWGKLVAGPTKVDIWGGNQQFARMMARVGTSSPAWIGSVLDGTVKDLKPSENPLKIIEQFLTYKLAPNAQMIRELATGKDALGQPAKPLAQSFFDKASPMILGELAETYNVWLNRTDPGTAAGVTAGAGLGSGLGLGVSTYEDSKPAAGSGSRPSRPVRPSRPKRPAR